MYNLYQLYMTAYSLKALGRDAGDTTVLEMMKKNSDDLRPICAIAVGISHATMGVGLKSRIDFEKSIDAKLVALVTSFKPGSGAEWDGTDGVPRFGVVMSEIYKAADGTDLVNCTVDTFFGDPKFQVPVEVSRLRGRIPGEAPAGYGAGSGKGPRRSRAAEPSKQEATEAPPDARAAAPAVATAENTTLAYAPVDSWAGPSSSGRYA
jgi:hypothetical protein